MFISKKDYDAICNRCEDLKNKLDAEREKTRMLENNEILILKEDKILRNIIKEIILVAESNTYNNDKLALRKIKELASTANQN
jgi:hypothetical protein